jgi:hypothetical protein
MGWRGDESPPFGDRQQARRRLLVMLWRGEDLGARLLSEAREAERFRHETPRPASPDDHDDQPGPR